MGLFDTDNNVFENEIVMSEEWMPESIPEREVELDKISKSFKKMVRNLGPENENVTPDNTFISGKTGQGKTVTTRFVLDELQKSVTEHDSKLTVVEISLQDASSSYQAVAKILTEIEEGTTHPPSGVGHSKLNARMFHALDKIGGHIIFLLDEVDNLGSDDDILYQIPRARSENNIENAYVSVVGISNDLEFSSRLSAKTRDSLYSNEVHFGAYDANDLRSILKRRASTAFKEDVVTQGAIAKTAALAASDTGSARQAIEILYQAGEIACERSMDVVTDDLIDIALDEIEEVNISNSLQDMTINDQALLLSLAILEHRNGTPARTKEVYSEYKRVTNEVGMEQLTMRSIREKLSDLETYKLALVHERSGGLQGGKHYVSELSTDIDALLNGFENIDRFTDIVENIDQFTKQSTLS